MWCQMSNWLCFFFFFASSFSRWRTHYAFPLFKLGPLALSPIVFYHSFLLHSQSLLYVIELAISALHASTHCIAFERLFICLIIILSVWICLPLNNAIVSLGTYFNMDSGKNFELHLGLDTPGIIWWTVYAWKGETNLSQLVPLKNTINELSHCKLLIFFLLYIFKMGLWCLITKEY